MSPEETQLLKGLFDRIRTASSTARDPEAEALIDQSVRDQPHAPYYLAQAVIVQEKGLEAAAAHIKQLEERIHQLETGAGDQQRGTQGGFLSSIFGTNQPQAPAPAPTPQPPQPQSVYRNDMSGQTSGPWGRSPSHSSRVGRGASRHPASDVPVAVAAVSFRVRLEPPRVSQAACCLPIR